MKDLKDKIFLTIFWILISFIGLTLFWSKNFVAYNWAYGFCFIFLICYAIFSPSTLITKFAQAIIYSLVLASQFLFNTLVISTYTDQDFIRFVYRIMGVLIIAAPFLIKQKFFKQYINNYPLITAEMRSVMSYSQLVTDRIEIADKIDKLKHAGEVLSQLQLQAILQNLPRHNSFAYVNDGVLTQTYFENAYQSIDSGYVYLVITRTMTLPSELIGLITNRPYNHISISFDDELKTLISYNGGQRVVPPGLNPEVLDMLTQKAGSAVLVYKLKATQEQKELMIDKIREINAEGSAYNLLGLVLKFSYKPNIMFCSQFIYTLLSVANLNYFDKKAIHVTPTDFIEMDYYRKLEFVYDINLNKESNESANRNPKALNVPHANESCDVTAE